MIVERPRLGPGEMVETLGLGWTGEEALAVGVYADLIGRDYADAIAQAATHSGDSDSTASVAGQILGARDGMSAVPPQWWLQLDLASVVERQAREFCRGFSVA